MAQTATGMGLILVSITFLGMAVFGMVALLARVLRCRPPQSPRGPRAEENALIREEWDLVRRRRCLPTNCPRTIGAPPRPRKDLTCEICAALYLDRHWRQVLGGTPGSRLPAENVREVSPRRHGGHGEEEGASVSFSVSPCLRGEAPTSFPPRVGSREPGTQRAVHRARSILIGGVALVLLGASLFTVSAHLMPGYLLVAAGICCLLRARAAR